MTSREVEQQVYGGEVKWSLCRNCGSRIAPLRDYCTPCERRPKPAPVPEIDDVEVES